MKDPPRCGQDTDGARLRWRRPALPRTDLQTLFPTTRSDNKFGKCIVTRHHGLIYIVTRYSVNARFHTHIDDSAKNCRKSPRGPGGGERRSCAATAALVAFVCNCWRLQRAAAGKTRMTRSPRQSISKRRVSPDELGRLAAFRMLLRQFQSFSEHASAELGLTSVQYQALLAIQTQQGDVPLTVKLLAQQLLVKHNSAVGLVDRIEQLGLAVRQHSESDRRSVVVELTPRGKVAMDQLAVEHRRELQNIAPAMGRYLRHFAKDDTTDRQRKPRTGAPG